MAIIVFGNGNEVCFSSHLMNSFCHVAQKYIQNERTANDLQLATKTGVIDLRHLSASECREFLNGVEEVIQDFQKRSGRMVNMISGAESIIIGIRETIRGKTE